MNIEDLNNPDWVPDEVLVCPGCDTEYPFEWNADEEVWWPGYAEWWHLGSIRFLCSKTCFIKATGWNIGLR